MLGLLGYARMTFKGGSSNAGEMAPRGETESMEPVSEIKDGAPSMETSEVDGEGRGLSIS